jgi:hypothetical protein
MIHIEADPDEAIYRLAEGVEEDASRVEGDIVSYGEMAWIEIGGSWHFAYIAEDGTGDGNIYQQSAGSKIETEEWDLKEEFEDQEGDEDEDDEESDAATG